MTPSCPCFSTVKNWIAALLVFSTAALARAQQPSADPPSFRSASSELVVLPVVVTDKDGGFISGLEQDRFKVFDNGRRQELAIFTGEDTPVTVGLLIDNSGSIGRKLREIIAGALAFAHASNPEDEVFALEFNDDVEDAIDGRQISAANFEELEAALATLRPSGQTALYDALLAGLDRVVSGSRPRKVLVLISDGGDNVSSGTLKQVMARARETDVTIYTIGLFDESAPDTNPGVLKDLANATGGRRFLPKSAGELLADCRHIAREIRSGYTLGYEPPDRDGRFHEIRVDVDRGTGPKLTVRTRPGYLAAAAPAAP